MPRPPLSLKAKALNLIAQREQSPVELRRKLLAHLAQQARRSAAAATPGAASAAPAAPAQGTGAAAVEPDEQAEAESGERQVDQLLDWLLAQDLLSTERFVETRIAARASRFGNLRIRQELSRHGLAVDEAASAHLVSGELARAQVVWVKRFGQAAPDAAGRAKQARFLAARGFSADVVRRVVRGVVGEEDE